MSSDECSRLDKENDVRAYRAGGDILVVLPLCNSLFSSFSTRYQHLYHIHKLESKYLPRVARSWLAALLSTTPLHSSLADLLFKSDKSRSNIDDARLFGTGAGFSAFGAKCKSMSYNSESVRW